MEYCLVGEVVQEATAGSATRSKTGDPNNTAGLKPFNVARNRSQSVERLALVK
jgi:hypothetical protein